MPAQIIFRCFARSTLCIKRDIARYGTTYNIFSAYAIFSKFTSNYTRVLEIEHAKTVSFRND